MKALSFYTANKHRVFHTDYPDSEKNIVTIAIPEIAIVMPFYNPGADWLKNFVACSKMLNEELAGNAKLKYIIVNDGSYNADLDKEVMRLCVQMDNLSYVTYKQNAGKGHALREGVKASGCQYTITMDIDFPYANKDVTNIISLLLRGFDVVTGKRDAKYFNNLPFERKIISKTFILMNRLFFKLPVYDTQAGIKGFSEKGKTVFLQTTISRFLADTEFIMRAHQQGLSLEVIPIHLRRGIVFSNFGSNTIITELKNFLKLVKLSRQKAN